MQNTSSPDFMAHALHGIVHRWVQLLEQEAIPAEYAVWQRTEADPALRKFYLETVVAVVGEILFLHVCRDKGLLEFSGITDHDIFLNEQRQLRSFFTSAFEWRVLNWWAPPPAFFTEIAGVFSDSNFTSISRDIVGKVYQLIVAKADRKLLGEFYTPDEVVHYILDSVGFRAEQHLSGKKIIDLSCGSGRFLSLAVTRMIASLYGQGYTPQQVLTTICSSVYGLDINPFACYLAELNLLMQLIDMLVAARAVDASYTLPRLHIYHTNTLEQPALLSAEQEVVHAIKTASGDFTGGFDFVLGNPPYVEAKKMDAATKQLCKASCPTVASGAFDLYVCFLDLGLRMLKLGGYLGYIVPNKVTIANYARAIRQKLLAETEILEIIDVSECGIFEKTSVYPIILTARKAKPAKDWQVRTAEHVQSPAQLREHTLQTTTLPQSSYHNGDCTFFILPAAPVEGNLLARLLDRSYPLLEEFLDVKWTISFHATGLREQFLFPEQPDSPHARKLIGGKSFAGNTDINRYRLDWGGWWIDYDEARARAHKNQLPPRQLFEREKLIICQHALRLRATYDSEQYYCKDTFFVAYPGKRCPPDTNLKFLLGLLNSRLLHYFYATIFKGTHVAGGYLHYLTGYLNRLPIASATSEQHSMVEQYVENLLATSDDVLFNMLDDELDELIYNLYGLSEEEKNVVRGCGCPGTPIS